MSFDYDREYDRVSETLRVILGKYIAHILYSAIASGAIVFSLASLINNTDIAKITNENLIENSLVLIVIYVSPWLIVSWAAGFVYLNIELWAHRTYLANIEKKQFRFGNIGLFSDTLEDTMYSVELKIFNKSINFTTLLSMLVGLFPLVVGLLAIYLGSYIIYNYLNYYFVPSIWVWFLTLSYSALFLDFFVSIILIKEAINSTVKSKIYQSSAQNSTAIDV